MAPGRVLGQSTSRDLVASQYASGVTTGCGGGSGDDVTGTGVDPGVNRSPYDVRTADDDDDDVVVFVLVVVVVDVNVDVGTVDGGVAFDVEVAATSSGGTMSDVDSDVERGSGCEQVYSISRYFNVVEHGSPNRAFVARTLHVRLPAHSLDTTPSDLVDMHWVSHPFVFRPSLHRDNVKRP